MVRVKVCGVTSVADAQLAAGAGAAAIGLNFCARSPRCVDVATAEAIVTALPRTVCRVGVFVDAPRQEVAALVERLRLDAVQFHGSESPAYCAGWRPKVIKALRVRDAATLAAAGDYAVDFILADAYVEGVAGGTGQRIPLAWVGDFDRRRLILAGGLTPETVAEAVRVVRPAAVDVASGVERAPGVKDPERVRRFIHNAQSA
jgi:phosphoribosylanthranilate isomerase